jgi:hypothetical protein
MSLFEEQQPDEWEADEIVPFAYAHALGVFTAYYNLLEAELAGVAGHYLGVSDKVRDLVYFGLSNRQRSDFVAAVVAAEEQNPKAIECIKHLLTCFDDCVQNRNILLHAIHGPQRTPTSLTRPARKRLSEDASREVFFDVNLARLRESADAARTTYEYLQELLFWLTERRRMERQLPLPDIPRDTPWSLPEKPPRPGRLIPLQLGPAPGKQKRPPRSSRAKSRSRNTQN